MLRVVASPCPARRRSAGRILSDPERASSSLRTVSTAIRRTASTKTGKTLYLRAFLVSLTLISAGMGVLTGGILLFRKRRSLPWRLAAAALLFLGSMLAVTAVVVFAYFHRPHPSPDSVVLFEAVEYARTASRDPVDRVCHFVTVDLRMSGVRFLVTPPDPSGGRQLRGSVTTEFLEKHGLQLAVNGDYFTPWYSRNPWDFYPRAGDPVDVRGLGISDGRRYGLESRRFDAIFFTPGGDVIVDPHPPEPDHLAIPGVNAISGGPVILEAGKVTEAASKHPTALDRHPRTALALTRSRNELIVAVIDGRQPNYSEGATLPELAGMLLERGGWDALNLDGGGSATLVSEGEGGSPRVLNSPIHTRIPGRERPVANHLGIRIGSRRR